MKTGDIEGVFMMGTNGKQKVMQKSVRLDCVGNKPFAILEKKTHTFRYTYKLI